MTGLQIREVSGYNGRYLVSNIGEVFSKVYGVNPRLLKGSNIGGYRLIQLFAVDGNSEKIMLHRIVAKEFCDGYRKGLDVNHKDGDKTNNRADNLEWVTRSQNIKHSFDKGLHTPKKGEAHYRCKLTNEQVIEIRAQYKRGIRNHTKSLADKYGVSCDTIRHIANKELWRHL